MITLTIIATFLIMMALCLIMGLFMEFGWAIFIIADIIIAVKFICWLLTPKKKDKQ